MTRRSKPKNSPATLPTNPEGSKPRAKRYMVAGLVLATLIAGVALFFISSSPLPAPASSRSPGPAVASGTAPSTVHATYVGAETCKTCHESFRLK